jgi:two-component system, NarL family, nitrate/nitrite response regulator NarL
MATQARHFGVRTHYSPEVRHRRIRAVVADDMPGAQKVTIEALERDGLVNVVGSADNGAMAVELVYVLAPDLVVLDINMPIMTGLEAARSIKESSPVTKVLVVSADDDPEVALCALVCGADGFIWKGNLLEECKCHIERMFLQ